MTQVLEGSSYEQGKASLSRRVTGDSFERDVIAGLSSQPKSLPCKYFYDERGSRLFESICETPEYYVTRTELALLREVSREVADAVGAGAWVLEPGAGVGEKIPVFLQALSAPRGFVPIDISESALSNCVDSVRAQFPELEVHGLVADFTRTFTLPDRFTAAGDRKVVFFPGSTISNFAPQGALRFLENLRAPLASGDLLFIGVDRIKDPGILDRAYNDSEGVTAEFNLNLLERIARELDSDVDPGNFRHHAFYDEHECRIEMHLVSRRKQRVRVGDRVFLFEEGESIHTENSYKYSPDGFLKLAREAGFESLRTFSDPEELFSMYLLRVGEGAPAA